MLDEGHPLQALLDVYSYTAMISLCITEHDVDCALKLAGEMKAKGIERNVHTCVAAACPCPPAVWVPSQLPDARLRAGSQQPLR